MAMHTPPHLGVAASTLNRILTGASGISPERALRLSEDLALISAKTFEHYDERAVEFREGTRDHDVKRNIEALPRVLSEWRAFLELAVGGRAGHPTAYRRRSDIAGSGERRQLAPSRHTRSRFVAKHPPTPAP